MNEIQEKIWTFPDDSFPVCQILHALEQTAGLHTTALGLTRDDMLSRYGAVWMIARAWMHFDTIPDMSLPMTVRTWHRGLTRGVVYRDFDLLQNGNRVGEAVQSWVLVDSIRRCLFRMDRVSELVNTPRPEITKTFRPGKPVAPHPLMSVSPICAGLDALDENGHINNAAYVRLVLQSLPIPLPHIQTLELCYHRECFAEQDLPRLLWQDEKNAYVRLLTPEGAVAFDLMAKAFD